jgi:hypothetical protein
VLFRKNSSFVSVSIECALQQSHAPETMTSGLLLCTIMAALSSGVESFLPPLMASFVYDFAIHQFVNFITVVGGGEECDDMSANVNDFVRALSNRFPARRVRKTRRGSVRMHAEVSDVQICIQCTCKI